MAVVYPEEHVLITVQGDAYNATETWQFSVRARIAANPLTDADCLAIATALAFPTGTFLTAPELTIGASARLTAIKVAKINTAGHYPVGHVAGLYLFAPPSPIGGVGAEAVPQVTFAVTLTTAIPRGRGSHGRFYLPPTYPVIMSDGRITAVVADGIEAAAKTWLNAINAHAQLGPVCVFSGLGAGTSAPVTTVGVGRVVDTMRSRRRALDEGRTGTPL